MSEEVTSLLECRCTRMEYLLLYHVVFVIKYVSTSCVCIEKCKTVQLGRIFGGYENISVLRGTLPATISLTAMTHPNRYFAYLHNLKIVKRESPIS